MPSKVACFLIILYQNLISPLFPSSCRYFPSCSAYAREALCVHGFRRGFFLAMRRILSCHPWKSGGFDPVPQDSCKG
ncbi:MAG: membrane protein insertion efficiency factor YidD [Cytophagales bacterium]|nr:membrane protein insertion efficiency factor YidD [Cytophagales bacterium]